MLKWLGRTAGIFILGAAAGVWLMALITVSETTREAKYQSELLAAIRESSSAAAAALDATLSELHVNEIHTERVIHKETIKPVFRNVCATNDYVRLFNETTDSAARTLSGGNAGTVPGRTAAPERADGK